MTLAEFLAQLSENPDKAAAYKEDSESVMEAAGLADADREALRSADADKITEHLGDDAPPGCLILPFVA